MSSSLAPAPKPPSSRRKRSLRFSSDPEKRSVQIGIVGTIAVHVLLILIAPRLSLIDLGGSAPQLADPQANTFSIEMDADQFLMPKPSEKVPMKFVETNPDAPDNVPDQTTNFSSQNTQAAQEKPTPDGKSDTPAVDGDKEKESQSIVSGQLAPPMPSAAPPTPVEEAEQQPQQAQARQEQIPLSGFEKTTGDDVRGLGSNIAKIAPNPSDSENYVEGAKDGAEVGEASGAKVKIDPKRPMARPSLPSAVKQARPAPLINNEFGTSNIGPVAYDAKWSEYGEYLKRLIDTVQVQWERIIIQSSVSPPVGSRVTVKFVLNSKGEIAEISPTDTNAGKQATGACVSAITARSPYGVWTEDMVTVLGQQQELVFTFYYGP